jgi:hypothetical protein
MTFGLRHSFTAVETHDGTLHRSADAAELAEIRRAMRVVGQAAETTTVPLTPLARTSLVGQAIIFLARQMDMRESGGC